MYSNMYMYTIHVPRPKLTSPDVIPAKDTGKCVCEHGPDWQCPRPCSRCPPACSCLWWDHFKCGPTTDTNGWVDGVGADVGSACQGLCLHALFLWDLWA